MLLEPQGLNIGSVSEDFAVESIAGDIFSSGYVYRILRVRPTSWVEDAYSRSRQSIPFSRRRRRRSNVSAAVARTDWFTASTGDLQLADRHPRAEPRQQTNLGDYRAAAG